METITEKEEHILRCAMEIFLERGRHGARMQEIADRAGVNKAMLHYYFRSKDKLYITIFENIFRRIFRQFDEIVDRNLPFEQFLRELIGNYIESLKNEPRFPLFVIRELSEGGKIVSEAVDRLIHQQQVQIPAIFMEKIVQEQQNGRLLDMDPRQILITVIGACLQFFIAEPIIQIFFVNDPDYDRDRFIEQRKEAVFNTIYYGIKVREEHP